MHNNPKHIIISRTDNIGDVVLTLPMATVLKRKFPTIKLSFLARDYVRAVAMLCTSIDYFISWDELQTSPTQEAIAYLKQMDADTIIHVFPNKKIAYLAKKAHIPYRIGTNHRWYHYLYCNQRVNLSRSKSDLHEAELNLKLLTALKDNTKYTINQIKKLIQLKTRCCAPSRIKSFLSRDKFNLIIHPLTNGHTREWPLEYFIKLINMLDMTKFHVLITGSIHEQPRLNNMAIKCKSITNLSGQLTLSELVELIAQADGLVANSTGPMHIAAALGIKTLGIFPPAKTMDPTRWQPLGQAAEYITLEKVCDPMPCTTNSDCACIHNITPQEVFDRIQGWLPL